MADCIKADFCENKKEPILISSNSNTEFTRGDLVFVEATVAYTDEFGKKCKLQNSCDEEEYWWVDMDKIHTSCYYKSDLGKTYSDGMSDAWKLVRKLYLEEEDGGIPFSDMNEIFGIAAFRDIVKMDVKDVIKKISEWQDSKAIHIGDIVTNKFSGKRAVVVDMNEFEEDYLCSLIYEDFTCARVWDNNLVKTDEHIDGLDELFAKIRGDQDVNQDHDSTNSEVIEDE